MNPPKPLKSLALRPSLGREEERRGALELVFMTIKNHHAIDPVCCEQNEVYGASSDWLYATPLPRQNGPAMITRLLSPAADSGHAPKKFEDLLARLEQIVSDMETGDMPLEKLLSSYEEGMGLVKSCGDRLTDAEQKVEILSRAAEQAKTAATSTEEKPATSKDDIKLF